MSLGTVLAAGVTGVFAFLVGKSTSKGEYITKQRESWRDYLRNWIEEMTILVSEYNECSKYDENEKQKLQRIIESKINSIIVRLNPVRDYKLINYLLCQCKGVGCNGCNKKPKPNHSCLNSSKQGKYDINLNAVTFYISKLLKSDWERVKANTSLFGDTLFLNLIFILFSTIVGYLALSQVGERFSFEILAMFLYVFFPYILIKISYNLLIGNEKVRLKNYQDIFNSKKTPYCGFKNLLENKKVELVITISYLVFLVFGCALWILNNELILPEIFVRESIGLLFMLIVVSIIIMLTILMLVMIKNDYFRIDNQDYETNSCITQDIGYGINVFYK